AASRRGRRRGGRVGDRSTASAARPRSQHCPVASGPRGPSGQRDSSCLLSVRGADAVDAVPRISHEQGGDSIPSGAGRKKQATGPASRAVGVRAVPAPKVVTREVCGETHSPLWYLVLKKAQIVIRKGHRYGTTCNHRNAFLPSAGGTRACRAELPLATVCQRRAHRRAGERRPRRLFRGRRNRRGRQLLALGAGGGIRGSVGGALLR